MTHMGLSECTTPGSQMDNNSEKKKLESELIRNRNGSMSCWFSHGFSKSKGPHLSPTFGSEEGDTVLIMASVQRDIICACGSDL